MSSCYEQEQWTHTLNDFSCVSALMGETELIFEHKITLKMNQKLKCDLQDWVNTHPLLQLSDYYTT